MAIVEAVKERPPGNWPQLPMQHHDAVSNQFFFFALLVLRRCRCVRCISLALRAAVSAPTERQCENRERKQQQQRASMDHVCLEPESDEVDFETFSWSKWWSDPSADGSVFVQIGSCLFAELVWLRPGTRCLLFKCPPNFDARNWKLKFVPPNAANGTNPRGTLAIGRMHAQSQMKKNGSNCVLMWPKPVQLSTVALSPLSQEPATA